MQTGRAAAVWCAYLWKVHRGVVPMIHTTGALFYSPVNFTG